jgi:hypothetical protein
VANKKIEIDVGKVEDYAARGATFEVIAAALGISEDTLSRRRKENAEFADAIKRGRAKGETLVEGALWKLIGKGNVAATIFYLKARCGWREVQKIETDLTVNEKSNLKGDELIKELKKRGLPTQFLEESYPEAET